MRGAEGAAGDGAAMTTCVRCERPIEPAAPVHRTPAGSHHGDCLAAEDLDRREGEERRRREVLEGREARRAARARLEADLADTGDVVRS